MVRSLLRVLGATEASVPAEGEVAEGDEEQEQCPTYQADPPGHTPFLTMGCGGWVGVVLLLQLREWLW